MVLVVFASTRSVITTYSLLRAMKSEKVQMPLEKITPGVVYYVWVVHYILCGIVAITDPILCKVESIQGSSASKCWLGLVTTRRVVRCR